MRTWPVATVVFSAFFVSGALALTYQLAWIRALILEPRPPGPRRLDARRLGVAARAQMGSRASTSARFDDTAARPKRRYGR